MPGLGTIINVIGIILGGILGLLFGNRLGQRVRDTIMAGCGVSVMCLGVGGALSKMLIVQDGVLTAGGTMMMNRPLIDLIAAHGNSLRALVKYFDDMTPEQILGVNTPEQLKQIEAYLRARGLDK